MVDQDITVVTSGEIASLLPRGWSDDPDLIPIDCPLDVSSISRTVESLGDCYYIILLPATELGMRMCEVVRRMHCKVPIVLVGESKDRETLLYSAQLGCMDFISAEDDLGTVKKKLGLYLRLYSMSQKIHKAEMRIK